jgi:hypothetical protein
MALMKGTKLVKKPEKPKKIRKVDDPVSLYLKDEWLSLTNRFSPFFSAFFKFLYIVLICCWPIGLLFLLLLYKHGDVSLSSFAIFILLFPVIYFLAFKVFKVEGKLRYLLTDGLKLAVTGRLLSPKNPSPGLRVKGTQLITSRYLVSPGPNSSYNGGLFRTHLAVLVFFIMAMFLVAMLYKKIPLDYLIIVNVSVHFKVALGLSIIVGMYFFYITGTPRYQPIRFFILDRKKQTLSYHPGLLSRKMVTKSWVEFEGRAVFEYRSGYSCKLIHAPTGQLLELQGPDLHWNNAGAVEAYSYVARFMDLSQSLPNKPEFERYLPEDKELALISDKDARIRHLFSKHDEREERREKYQNPPADVVFGNIKTFDFLVKDHPWLSAKNVWNAAHKYNREPNWDKWVRDKWGLAANEDYQVPEDEKEGEPEWFDNFYAFLKANRRKIKPMDDDSRIQFTQDWFEETFPEEHWVDPVTADSYDQEENFS